MKNIIFKILNIYICFLFLDLSNSLCNNKGAPNNQNRYELYQHEKYKYLSNTIDKLQKFPTHYKYRMYQLIIEQIYKSGRYLDYPQYFKNVTALIDSMRFLFQDNNSKIGFQCPEANEIEPCICSNVDDVTLDCSKESSFTEIKNIIAGAVFPDTRFIKFRYIAPEYSTSPNLTQMILPDYMLGPLSFEEIFIQQTELVTIQEEAFNGSQNTLIGLHLDNNYALGKFPFNKLKEFEQLEILYIIEGQIGHIESIGDLPNLKSITIVSNCISSIDNGAIQGLPSLNLIDLYNNKLSIIETGALQLNTSSKVYIHLNRNQISYLAPFEDTQPTGLDLYSNDLTEFPEDIYKPVLDDILLGGDTGNSIDVRNNSIDCSSMEWVLDNLDYKDHIATDCLLKLLAVLPNAG